MPADMTRSPPSGTVVQSAGGAIARPLNGSFSYSAPELAAGVKPEPEATPVARGLPASTVAD